MSRRDSPRRCPTTSSSATGCSTSPPGRPTTAARRGRATAPRRHGAHLRHRPRPALLLAAALRPRRQPPLLLRHRSGPRLRALGDLRRRQRAALPRRLRERIDQPLVGGDAMKAPRRSSPSLLEPALCPRLCRPGATPNRYQVADLGPPVVVPLGRLERDQRDRRSERADVLLPERRLERSRALAERRHGARHLHAARPLSGLLRQPQLVSRAAGRGGRSPLLRRQRRRPRPRALGHRRHGARHDPGARPPARLGVLVPRRLDRSVRATVLHRPRRGRRDRPLAERRHGEGHVPGLSRGRLVRRP